MTYAPPTAGTFYVPPQHAKATTDLPPLTGDFARGARTIPSKVAIVWIVVDSPDELKYP